jgi:hypothetical protein
MLAFCRSLSSALLSMSQTDRSSKKDNKSGGNEPSFNWRGVVLIAIAFALIALAVLFRGGAYNNVEEVPYNRFLELLENKEIVADNKNPLHIVVRTDGQPKRSVDLTCGRALARRRPSRSLSAPRFTRTSRRISKTD